MSNWMAEAFHKHKGALHRQLGYRQSETLPPALIRDIAHANTGTCVRGYTVTPLLKKRAMLVYNARKR